MLDWIQNVSEIIIGIKHPKSHPWQCKTAAELLYFMNIFKYIYEQWLLGSVVWNRAAT